MRWTLAVTSCLAVGFLVLVRTGDSADGQKPPANVQSGIETRVAWTTSRVKGTPYFVRPRLERLASRFRASITIGSI